MNKKEAFNKYKSIPIVEEVIKHIPEDKNWVFDLYELVEKRISHFLKLQYFENDNIREDLIFFIFGNILLTIAESNERAFLTPVIPIRISYEQKFQSKYEKGGIIIGKIPLDAYDTRRLIKPIANSQINKYLNIVKIFVKRMNKDQSFALDNILSLTKEITDLKAQLKSALLKSPVFKTSGDMKSSTTRRRGKKSPYETFEDLRDVVKRIPAFNNMTQTQLSKILGYKGESGLRNLLKTFNKSFKELISQ